MSVATEITRIQGAKADLKTSIESKGVTVPSSALIDEYADYVDAIQTGGGDTAMDEFVKGTLTSYTIPNDVTSIRKYLFAYFNGLTSVNIPNSVTEIGDSAFESCSSLTSITIPGSVTTIGNNAFRTCTRLASFTIHNGVTTIGSMTFYDCTGLTSITIPNSVTTIGSMAFRECVQLQAIIIPSNVTTINNDIIKGCMSLKYIKFSGLTPPSIYSYSNLSANMEDILVPQSAVSDYVTAFPLWENRIFADTHTHDYSVTELRYSDQTGSTPFTQLSDTTLNASNVSKSNLKRVYIGNNVTTVEQQTFYSSSSASILIPEVNSLETISNQAFLSSNVIGDLYLPNVTSIGSNAFNNNRNMLSVTIGDKITLIGQQAFGNCEKLTSVTCLATTPPTLISGAFVNTNDCPIYVPAESVEAYKAASGWSAYASRIQAIPTA